MTEPLLTPEQAAASLGVGPRWLMAQARHDPERYPSTRLGRRVRFTSEQVGAIVAAHQRGRSEQRTTPTIGWGRTPAATTRDRRSSR